MVYEHCKKLLESLMLLAANQDHPEAARLLLSYQTNLDDTLEMISEVKDASPNETGIPCHHGQTRVTLDLPLTDSENGGKLALVLKW